MKKNVLIFLALAFLALVPVSLFFLFSGEDEDVVEDYAEEVAVPSGGAVPSPQAAPSGVRVPGAASAREVQVPVFKGFENPRYQKHDRLIARIVADFNANRAKWAGASGRQGTTIPEITAAQVKAHMIQETGGGDLASRTAWTKDPLQVNVPGDWNPYKKYLGLREPRRRNEGSYEGNLKAGLMLLSRKGFGVAGQPAGNRPDGAFDGWKTALQRYNGRSDKTAEGQPYREAYAGRILQRAGKPSVETPIPIPTRKRK